MIIDTHMHIFEKEYNEIIDIVINEAINMNVKKMIVVGYDKESSIKAIKLSKKYPFIYPAIGLHPSEVHKESDKELGWLKDLLEKESVVAVGEIGLDYYWDKQYKDLQIEMFEKQISIANDYNLPVIVHCRDAINDCYNTLKENNCIKKGVMHCFSSSLEMANEFIKLGFYIGIGGVVTFKNSKEIKEVVKSVDLKYLLSETDSPYLTPEPFRGKINKPGYTKYVIEKISQLKNIEIDDIEKALEENAIRLFKIGD